MLNAVSPSCNEIEYNINPFPDVTGISGMKLSSWTSEIGSSAERAG